MGVSWDGGFPPNLTTLKGWSILEVGKNPMGLLGNTHHSGISLMRPVPEYLGVKPIDA